MSKDQESYADTLCTTMQQAVLIFGGTLLLYLDQQLSDAMNNADERFAAEDFEGCRYWNGRADLANQLIGLLQPLANGT